MYCYNCGTKLINNASFCYNCGTKALSTNNDYNISDITEKTSDHNLINATDINYKKKEFWVNGNKIEFNNGLCEYIEFRSKYEKKAFDERSFIFNQLYEISINDEFDTFIESVPQYIEKSFDKFINMGLNDLFKYNIDFIDENVIRTRVLNNVNVKKIMMPFEDGIKRIKEKIEYYDSTMKMRQTHRGNYWSGGGFGIKGALVGSFKAELMNAGSVALGSIYEGLNSVTTNAEIESMKKDFIKDIDVWEAITDTTYFLCFEVFNVVMTNLTAFFIKIDENYNKDIRMARMNNTLKMWRNANISKSDAIKKILQCVQEEPWNLDYYVSIHIINNHTRPDLIRVCEYLGKKDELIYLLDNSTNEG